MLDQTNPSIISSDKMKLYNTMSRITMNLKTQVQQLKLVIRECEDTELKSTLDDHVLVLEEMIVQGREGMGARESVAEVDTVKELVERNLTE